MSIVCKFCALLYVTLFSGRVTRQSGTNCCHVICCQDIIADGANVLILLLVCFDMILYYFQNVCCRDGKFNKAGKVKHYIFTSNVYCQKLEVISHMTGQL